MKRFFLNLLLVCFLLTACGSFTNVQEVLNDDAENQQNESVPSPPVESVEILDMYKPDITSSAMNTEHVDSFKWEEDAIAAMVFFDYRGSDRLDGEFINWPSAYSAYADVYSIFADVPIGDVKTLVLPGDEVYCIIPRYKNSQIIANTLDIPNENEIGVGDIVFDEITEAFVINCNESDLFPNVQITIVADNKTVTFSPFISLRDGEVMACEDVQVLYLEEVYAWIPEMD